MAHIYEIDICRIVAISAVIAYHVSLLLNFQGQYIILAYLGNSLFFLVAGYLATSARIDSIKDILFRMKKRVWRLAPLYYLALMILIVIQLSGLPYDWNKNFSIASILAHIFFLQIFTPTLPIPPLWFVSALLVFELIYYSGQLIREETRIFYFFVSIVVIYILTINKNIPSSTIYYFPLFLIGTFGKIGNVIGPLPKFLLVLSNNIYAIYLFHFPILVLLCTIS